MKIKKIKLKNWFAKVLSHFCKKNDIPVTYNIPYNSIENNVHKIRFALYVTKIDDELIKSKLSVMIAEHIIENNLIDYKVDIGNSISSELVDDNYLCYRIESTFLMFVDKNRKENKSPCHD